MGVTFALLILMLASKPLYNFGSAAYVGLKQRDYSRFKANLLFLGITLSVYVGINILIFKM